MKKQTSIEKLEALKKKMGITKMSFTVKPGSEVSAEDVAADALVMLKAIQTGDYKDITKDIL